MNELILFNLLCSNKKCHSFFLSFLALHTITCRLNSSKRVKVQIAIIVRSVPVVKETRPIDGNIIFDLTQPIVPFNIWYRFAKKFVSLSFLSISLTWVNIFYSHQNNIISQNNLLKQKNINKIFLKFHNIVFFQNV